MEEYFLILCKLVYDKNEIYKQLIKWVICHHKLPCKKYRYNDLYLSPIEEYLSKVRNIIYRN